MPVNRQTRVFPYYRRLSARDKRTYRESDAVEAVLLPEAARLRPAVQRLVRALAAEDRAAVNAYCQAIADGIVVRLELPPVKVRVLAVRPVNHYGELHGLYEPGEGRKAARISLWMRTARKKQVVAFKSFLRTLLHELCHHLDYEYFRFPETFHTQGFYKRESSLFHQLYPESGGQSAARRAG